MNTRVLSIPAFETLALSSDLIADLRSDHAGETGAVYIYKGVLAVTRDPELRKFALTHIEAEERHLAFFDSWLPVEHHSRALRLWRLAGWLLGAVPALFGKQAVYSTVGAVESFVEQHYLDQIKILKREPRFAELRHKLQDFCDEEVHHREDAHSRMFDREHRVRRAWAHVVGFGSSVGVKIARKI